MRPGTATADEIELALRLSQATLSEDEQYRQALASSIEAGASHVQWTDLEGPPANTKRHLWNPFDVFEKNPSGAAPPSRPPPATPSKSTAAASRGVARPASISATRTGMPRLVRACSYGRLHSSESCYIYKVIVSFVRVGAAACTVGSGTAEATRPEDDLGDKECTICMERPKRRDASSSSSFFVCYDCENC